MNKNVAIAIIAVLVLAGLGYWFLIANKADENTPKPVIENNSMTNPDLQDDAENKQPVNDSTSLEPVTVTYTDSGFSPSTMTIKLGQKVIFKNNGSVPIEPASNNHPTHNIYSEFDANSPVAAGGTYEFTFTKRGTWGYHNHLNSSETGTIVVE